MINVVAIHSLKEDKETVAGALAAVLRSTVYEALSRLRVSGPGPVVVAVFAEEKRAVQLAAELQTAGFLTAVLVAGEIENETRGLIAKTFSLEERELRLNPGKGAGNADCPGIPLPDIDLILRGTGIVTSTDIVTEKNRSLNLGLAVLTGGLMTSKTTKTVREVITDDREGFVNLYTGHFPPLVLRENTLDYASLGPELKHSRSANFNYLVAELRRRCPSARYDDRLLTRAGQAALLGPLLIPEKNLAVATALLSKVLREVFRDKGQRE